MAPITRIEAQIQTGNINNAGTDGDVYLGICGREFHLDSKNDDYERKSNQTYILGDATFAADVKVTNPDQNDPRKDYGCDSGELNLFPVYIRFDPSGSSPDWDLDGVTVVVKTGPANAFATARTYSSVVGLGSAAAGGDHLWLGTTSGKFCYLKDVSKVPPIG